MKRTVSCASQFKKTNMAVDQVLKDLLQLCADVQDGLFQGATQAQEPGLAALLQTYATEWNAFADRIFPILLTINHTSPEAKWKANIDRDWMNPAADPDDMDDLAVCDESLQGLSIAKHRLQDAQGIGMAQVRMVLQQQLRTVEDQISALVRYVEHVDRRPA